MFSLQLQALFAWEQISIEGTKCKNADFRFASFSNLKVFQRSCTFIGLPFWFFICKVAVVCTYWLNDLLLSLSYAILQHHIGSKRKILH